MLMKKMLAIILVSLVLSGCEKNGSQNDLIINNTEEENVVMDENDDYIHGKQLVHGIEFNNSNLSQK